MANITTLQDN